MVMSVVAVDLRPARVRGRKGVSGVVSAVEVVPASLGAFEPPVLDPVGLESDILPRSVTNPLNFFPKFAPP